MPNFEMVTIKNNLNDLNMLVTKALFEDGFSLSSPETSLNIMEISSQLQSLLFPDIEYFDGRTLSQNDFEAFLKKAIRTHYPSFQRHSYPILNEAFSAYTALDKSNLLLSKMDSDERREIVASFSRISYFLASIGVDYPAFLLQKGKDPKTQKVIDQFYSMRDTINKAGGFFAWNAFSEEEEQKTIDTIKEFEKQIVAWVGEDRVKNGQEMDVHYLALFELNLNIENGLSVYSWIQKYIDEVDKCFPGAKDMYEKGLSLTGTETAIPAPMLVASYIAYWYNAYKEADVSHKLSDRGLMKAAIWQDCLVYRNDGTIPNHIFEEITYFSCQEKLWSNGAEQGSLSVYHKCDIRLVYLLINILFDQAKVDSPSLSVGEVVSTYKNMAQNLVDYFEPCLDGRKPNKAAEGFRQVAEKMLEDDSFVENMNGNLVGK